MAVPTFVAAGAGASTTTTSLSVPYPAGLSAGDLLILAVLVRDNVETPSTPAGWNVMSGASALNIGGTDGTAYGWVFTKTAVGTETGNLAVTISGVTSITAGRMAAVTGTAATVESIAVLASDSTDTAHAAVTTTDVDRLVFAVVMLDDDETVGAFTGTTGGTWSEPTAEYAPSSGGGLTIQFQTADKATAGTVSGGTYTMGAAEDYTTVAFAILPTSSSSSGGGTTTPPTSRQIPWYRMIGKPGLTDADSGVVGRSYAWLYPTSPNRTYKPGSESGSFFREGETWYQIFAFRPATGATRAKRFLNWHDVAVSGYDWGSVSPVAIDDGSTNDSGTVGNWLVLEYAGSCGQGKHFAVPFRTGEWNYLYVKTLFSTSCSGTVQVWLQNSTTSLADGPIVDLSSIRTLNSSSLFWPGVQLWQGFYFSSGFNSGPNIQIDQILGLAGQSWQAAWDDVPSVVRIVKNPENTVTLVGTLDIAQFPVPTEISSQITNPPTSGSGGGGGTSTPAEPSTVLTVGTKSVGETTASASANYRRGSVWKASDTMTVTDGYVCVVGNGNDPDSAVGCRILVYEMTGDPDSGGVPGDLVAQSDAIQIPETTAQTWARALFTTTATLYAGNWYLVQLHTSADGLTIHYHGGVGHFLSKSDTWSDGSDTEHGSPDISDARQMSIVVSGTHVSSTGFKQAANRTATPRTSATAGGIL